MTATMEGMRPPKNRFEQIIWEVGRVYNTALREVNKQFAEGYITPYRNPKFKNHINPVEVARRTLELIKEKFDENLHTPEERVHILEHSRYVDWGKYFGGANAKTVINLINKEDTETQQEFAALRDELEHTIPTLERCDELVYEYVHEYIEQLQNPKKDKRKSEKQPTNAEKLRALKEFAPDFIKSLDGLKRQDKGKIVFLITGVNAESAYQMLWTTKAREVDKAEIKDLERLKKLLTKDPK